jgi:hypothetical protein
MVDDKQNPAARLRTKIKGSTRTIPYDKEHRATALKERLEEPPPEYVPHEFAELFPPISNEDLEKLAASIRKEGLREPITLYEGKILDGVYREKACRMAGVQPTYQELPSRKITQNALSS